LQIIKGSTLDNKRIKIKELGHDGSNKSTHPPTHPPTRINNSKGGEGRIYGEHMGCFKTE